MDLTAIHNAVADAITKGTGLRADGQARDQVTPPCAVVLPGQPYLTYGVSSGDALGLSAGTINISLTVLVIISDAAPVEKTQRALFAYLSAGEGADVSVADAIESDATLAGTAHFVSVLSAASPSRFEYAGQTYFGSRLSIQVGAF